MAKATLLLVDDELIVRRTLGEALARAGYAIETAASGTEALERLGRPGVDLLLLDLQLGDINGVQVMQAARERWPRLPILMLTAHGSLPSAIAAVRYAAADYLLKPIRIDALRERVAEVLADTGTTQARYENLRLMYEQMRGFLQREGVLVDGTPSPPRHSLESGPLRIDEQRHTVSMRGQTVDITPSEFAILAELLRRPDAVVSCAQLTHAIGNHADDEEEARQIIRPHIVRLRRKLEPDPQQPTFLISVRGVGYRWVGEGNGVES
ncbi:MAG TPA: response regulator transcription factor [Roseiflexaceae bacterium]|nr:response regulator transcription factor [Roseiflexaceae bacterium]